VEEVAKMVESAISSSSTTHRSTNFDGEWHPLGVWKERGYDPDLIVATSNPSNSKQHPRWGTVYKIVTENDSSGTRHENRQVQRAIGREKAKKTKSSSSSGAISFTSSESEKPKKKKTKAKKEKRKGIQREGGREEAKTR